MMTIEILAARILAAHGGDVALAAQAACRTASRSSRPAISDRFAEAVYHIRLLGEGCPR